MEPYYSFELVLGGYVKDESSMVYGSVIYCVCQTRRAGGQGFYIQGFQSSVYGLQSMVYGLGFRLFYLASETLL